MPSNYFKFLFFLLFLPQLINSVSAEGDFESIFFSTPEKLLSVQVELLFEERKLNDEGVEILSAPKSEPREAQLTFLGRERWEIRVLLKKEDRKRAPTITSVVITERGALLALPNRSLGGPESNLESLLPGSISCIKEPSILSGAEIAALGRQERVAFIRSREDDAAKFASEVNAMLSDSVAQVIYQEEKRLGVAPSQPIARQLTVDEIVRRLIVVESLWKEQGQ
jgi:hypothetical protein